MPKLCNMERDAASSARLMALRSYAFERLNAGAAVLDPTGVIVDTNEAWRLFAHLNGGAPTATGPGVNYLDVCAHAAGQGEQQAVDVEGGLRAILSGDRAQFDMEYPCDSPTEERWFRLQAASAPVSGGSGVVLFHLDITSTKLRERRLRDRAERDPLTGLPNRAGAHRHLAGLLADSRPSVVMFLDLDGFKMVNDQFGHHVGDELLVKVSSRLRRIVRSEDLVCRVGGDEFVVVCGDLAPQEAERLSRRIAEVMEPPFQVGSQTVSVGASVGRAASTPDSTVESMIRSADSAMYDAKGRSHARRSIERSPDSGAVRRRSSGAPGELPGIAELPRRGRATPRCGRIDELTGLPDRHGLLQALAEDETRPGTSCAVGMVLFDLDGFSDVNDTFGHEVGDAVLGVVAGRIRHAVPREYLVAGLGGDRFAVYGQFPLGARTADELAATLRSSLAQTIRLGGHDLFVSCTIGLAVGPKVRARELVREADLALSHAKRTDRGGIAQFHPRLGDEATRRLYRSSDLRRAIAQRMIVPYYQPIIELTSGRVVAVEALARWMGADPSPMSPEEFIPLAESSGLVEELGRQIIERSCADAAEWGRRGRRLQLAVNVSGVQLSRHSFVQTVDSALRSSGLPASQLTIEVTETAALREPVAALAVIQALRDRSVTLSLDDFGTGYSPLAALRDLPVTAIKLDRSFVAGLGAPSTNRFVAGVVQLGLAADVHVVAEGIETRTQAEQMLAYGCLHGQGFLWSPAVAAGDLLATVDQIENRAPAGVATQPADHRCAGQPR